MSNGISPVKTCVHGKVRLVKTDALAPVDSSDRFIYIHPDLALN